MLIKKQIIACIKLIPCALQVNILFVFFTFTFLFLLNLNNYAAYDAIKSFNEADTFPIPPAEKNMLFYLQRTPNTNTIIYELNYKSNGNLNEEEPIHVYWIRYGEPGHPKKELNYIQRKFAYGLKVKQQQAGRWDVRLISYDKIPLTLRRGRDGKYKVFVKNRNKDLIFQKAYIKIDGGTFWSPNVIYIELTGIDEVTRTKITWKVYP